MVGFLDYAFMSHNKMEECVFITFSSVTLTSPFKRMGNAM